MPKGLRSRVVIADIANLSYDLLITDNTMPKVPGVESLKELQAGANPHGPGQLLQVQVSGRLRPVPERRDIPHVPDIPYAPHIPRDRDIL